jgi:UrcA family protein
LQPFRKSSHLKIKRAMNGIEKANSPGDSIMSSHQNFRIVRYVAVAMTALSFGAIAQADEAATATTPASKVIRYSDLDLSKDADVRQLYSRLQRASSHVCVQYKDSRDLRVRRIYDACYQESLARAVDSVGHAAVKAVYAADERIRLAGRSAPSAT